MESLINHFKTTLEGILINTGTEEDPVNVRLFKEVAVDDGQLNDKVSLQLPAVYFDITDMAYTTAGENLGMADTEVTVRLAVKKDDPNRIRLINDITKALVGTHGEKFSGIVKESQRKMDYEDIFEYRITFGCMLYDTAAVPEYDTLTGDDRPVFKIE